MLNSPHLHFRTDYLSICNDDAFNNVTCLALCQNSDILSVANRNGIVSFFDLHGQRHPAIHDIICKDSYYSMLLWNPSANEVQLFGGMENGHISLVLCSSGGPQENSDAYKYELQRNKSIHSNSISNLKSKGNSLLSIDITGHCCFWRVSLDSFTPIHQIYLDAAPCTCLDILVSYKLWYAIALLIVSAFDCRKAKLL